MGDMVDHPNQSQQNHGNGSPYPIVPYPFFKPRTCKGPRESREVSRSSQFFLPSNAAGSETVALPPAAPAPRRRQQRAPRAVPVVAPAGPAPHAAVRRPSDLELVPLHGRLRLHDSCKDKWVNLNFHYRL